MDYNDRNSKKWFEDLRLANLDLLNEVTDHISNGTPSMFDLKKLHELTVLNIQAMNTLVSFRENRDYKISEAEKLCEELYAKLKERERADAEGNASEEMK